MSSAAVEEKKTEDGSELKDFSHLDAQFPHSNDDLNETVYSLSDADLFTLLNKLTDKTTEKRDVLVFHSYIPMRDSYFKNVICQQFFKDSKKTDDEDGFVLRPRHDWDKYPSWSVDHQVCSFYLGSHRYFRVTCQNILEYLKQCIAEKKSEHKRRKLMGLALSQLKSMLGGLGRHSRAEEHLVFPTLEGLFEANLQALAEEHHSMHHLEKKLRVQFECCVKKTSDSGRTSAIGRSSESSESTGPSMKNIMESIRLMLLFDRTLFRHLHEEETLVVPMLVYTLKPYNTVDQFFSLRK